MKFKQLGFHELVSKTPNIRGIPTNEYKSEGRYPVIDQGNKFIAGYSDNENALYKDTLPVVIFGDHTLSVKYLDFPFCVGADGTQILKPNTDVIIGKFLYYAIINLNIQSLGYSRHFKVLKNSIFHVPEIEEQHRIVRILDLAQSLIEKRKQAIAYLDDYIKAVFLDMFGDPVSNPKGWEVGKIGDLVSEINYGTSAKAGSIGKFPYLRMNNITYNGEFNLCDLKYIDLAESDIDKYTVAKGDLLFNRTNSKELVGKTAVVNFETSMAFAGYLIRVRTNKKAIPEYISGYLNSKHGKTTLMHMCKSIVGMANINAKELQKMRILIPSVETQELYKKIYHDMQSLKQKMQTQLRELVSNFQVELQRAFKGEESFSDAA